MVADQRMLWNARALQCAAQAVEEASCHRPTDELLLSASVLAVPVLLALATEIALKASLSPEQRAAREFRTHDLVTLFDGLPVSTRARLEEALPEFRDPYLPPAHFPPVVPSMRHTLHAHRDTFSSWRYLHEQFSGQIETSSLERALCAILAETAETARSGGPARSPDSRRLWARCCPFRRRAW